MDLLVKNGCQNIAIVLPPRSGIAEGEGKRERGAGEERFAVSIIRANFDFFNRLAPRFVRATGDVSIESRVSLLASYSTTFTPLIGK